MDRGKHQSGFTLIELMVALAIAMIVITLSTPLSNIYKQNRVTTQVHNFVTDLNLARSTAVSNGSCVSLCIKNNDFDPEEPESNRCKSPDTATETWEDGWLVFTDSNCNASIDNEGAIDGDTIIKTHSQLAKGFSLLVNSTNAGEGADNNNDRETITYQASGTTPDSAGMWTLCDPSASDKFKRGIEISVSGRVKIYHDVVKAKEDDDDLVFVTCPTS